MLNTTGANKYAFQILPLLLDGCRSPEASIRQSALYGLGSVAEHRPQLFQAVAQDALTRIMAVITAPNSRYCCHLCTVLCPHVLSHPLRAVSVYILPICYLLIIAMLMAVQTYELCGKQMSCMSLKRKTSSAACPNLLRFGMARDQYMSVCAEMMPTGMLQRMLCQR